MIYYLVSGAFYLSGWFDGRLIQPSDGSPWGKEQGAVKAFGWQNRFIVVRPRHEIRGCGKLKSFPAGSSQTNNHW